MGRTFGFASLLIVLVAGLYLYTRSMQSVAPGGAAPTTTIDVAGVNTDLMALANAEKRYFATNGKYAALDELETNGDVHVPKRPSYAYSAEVADNTFKIIATYSGADAKAPQHVSIDESMSLKTY